MGLIQVTEPAAQLGTTKSSFRLNQIDKIRANGVGNHISLPQLVVCGDQSAGKNSVLERLTNIPFPRQDGLCTRFATEIILRHSDSPQEIIATINPDTGCEPESREVLQSYRKKILDFSELPNVIEETALLMGLRGFEDSSGSAFALDTLRIEVSGPTGIHLTIVDLPGLILVANEEQSDEDVRIVHHLVERYLESSRTIILADGGMTARAGGVGVHTRRETNLGIRNVRFCAATGCREPRHLLSSDNDELLRATDGNKSCFITYADGLIP